ncbi:putative diphthamide synthesis protein-domain-containing protein [Mrakia frigida]|uniref:2-(3-amino-3-carboxypropyl)histidine synthase n=1 Tax=Mrakia frigida TaxID=29902 RepID=UPI003FCC01EC
MSSEAGPSTLPPPPKPKSSASRPKKRFVGTTSSSAHKHKVPLNHIPQDILEDKELNDAIATLPSNYNFEIHKTVHQIRRDKITAVALQMPEGLMLYGCTIGDILERFTSAHPILLADVTYGACCIDDYTARSLGAEMIVHYGHSCLIPTTQTLLKTLYVFVEISIDSTHLISTIRSAFPSSKQAFARGVLDVDRGFIGKEVDRTVVDEMLASSKGLIEVDASPENVVASGSEPLPTKLALVSTIQFVAAVQTLKAQLELAMAPLEGEEVVDGGEEGEGAVRKMKKREEDRLVDERKLWRGRYEVVVPQTKPLSPGEILGCTAPKLAADVDALLYVGDGRFHLESIMIANPTVPAFRYDPYDKKFTREVYDHGEMRAVRAQAVGDARKSLVGVGAGGEEKAGEGRGAWAVVLGTLGRQGNLSVLNTVTSSIPPTTSSTPPPLPILISELSPAKLSLFPPSISIFVQTSCPRLSIDWGAAFGRPVLTPYEASVAVGRIEAGWEGGKGSVGKGEGKGDYPMDFYSDDSLGPWTPRHGLARPKRATVAPASA